MKPHQFRNVPRLAALAASFLLSGVTHAVEPPRVMFVSATDIKPVIIDLQGKEVPAKKGMVIEPGFTVKVPEGATLQIMTPEKSTLALRPNSLLKLESVGEGKNPYVLKLTTGGIRVGNSEKKPHRFEVNTPNAKIKFDKGDSEAFYLQDGKLKDGRWGTFVRGFKDDDVVLSTSTGDVKVARQDIGFVQGLGKEKPTVIARVDTTGKAVTNPVSYVPGAKEIGTTDMVENFKVLNDDKVGVAVDVNTRAIAPSKGDLVTLPALKDYSVKTIPTPDLPLPPPPKISPVAGLDKALTMPDLKAVAGLSTIKTGQQDQALKPEIVLANDGSKVIPVVLKSNGDVVLPSTSPSAITTISAAKLKTNPTILTVCKKGQKC